MARVIGDGSYFMVYDLCVRKEYQGKGVGKLLVTEILDWYKDIEDEDTVLHLGSAEGKEKFYEKFGFVARPYSGVGASMKYDPEFQKQVNNLGAFLIGVLSKKDRYKFYKKTNECILGFY